MNSDSPQDTSGQEEQDIFDVIFPGSQCRPSDVHQAKRTYSKPDETPLWKKIVEVGTFAGVITFAYIYNGQLTQMRLATEASTRAANLASDALELNSGQFDRMMKQTIHQTVAQVEAANANERSAEAATKSLTTIKEQFQAEQRPYIILAAFDMNDPIKGNPLAIEIHYKNIGKSPALDFVVRRHILFGAAISNARVDPPDAKSRGTEHNLDAGQTTFTVEESTTGWDGSEPIMLYGRISYHDIRGKYYCTPYMAQYVAGNKKWLRVESVGSVKSPDLCLGINY